MLPKFIIVRFTHGSGGKFLSTALQTSCAVDHWDQSLHQSKNTSSFRLVACEYVSKKFPMNHKKHLKNEPMVPYNTDLYSSSYDRGRDVTLDQYLAHALLKKDTRLLTAIESGLKINLIMQHPKLPVFCEGADSVVIIVDNDRSLQWLNQTLWNKHFLEKDDQIFYLPDHPKYCSPASLNKVLEYNNAYQFPNSQKHRLWQEKIMYNHMIQKYLEAKNFESKSGNTYYFPLSSLLSTESFLDHMIKIFVFFELGEPEIGLLARLHHIWLSRQIMY